MLVTAQTDLGGALNQHTVFKSPYKCQYSFVSNIRRQHIDGAMPPKPE